MKKVLYYLSSLLVLTGCSQETDFFSDGTGDQAGFKFELTTAGTRTTTDDNFKTTFTEGDQVGLFVVSRTANPDGTLAASGNYADNRKLTYTGGVWQIDREVVFPADGETLVFYAYYPYVENVDPSAIAYDATQSMCDLLMARTGGVDNSTETVTLTFSHQLSLVDAQVTDGAASAAVLSGVKPAASFNLGKFGTDEVMTVTSTEAADINMEKVAPKHFRAYVPAQDGAEGKITISSGEKSQAPSTLANSAFKTGTAYKYNIVSTLIALADLPNCYIVKPGESVTFPVLKAYEVWRTIKFIYNGNLRNEGELGVALVWQDAQSLIPADGGLTLNLNAENPDQSTITVKTNPGNGGNALVSVTMGGDKVWSWHIWITDFDPDANTANVDNNGDGTTDYVFMDRNLGAMTADVSSPRSVGMYYQGGNNEPFAGFTDKFPTDGAKISDVPLYDIDNNPVNYTRTGDIWGADQGQSVRRILTAPGLFVTAPGEPYSWITNDPNATLLYGPNFWTEEATGEKGVFDPSPAGWMVPAYKNGLSPWNMYLDGNTVLIDPFTVYPKGGRIKFNGTFGNVDNVMLFSGTMDGLKNNAFQCGTNWGQINNYSTANGLNVRCVKIQ